MYDPQNWGTASSVSKRSKCITSGDFEVPELRKPTITILSHKNCTRMRNQTRAAEKNKSCKTTPCCQERAANRWRTGRGRGDIASGPRIGRVVRNRKPWTRRYTWQSERPWSCQRGRRRNRHILGRQGVKSRRCWLYQNWARRCNWCRIWRRWNR